METFFPHNPKELAADQSKEQKKQQDLKNSFNTKIEALFGLKKYVEVLRNKRSEIEQKFSLGLRQELKQEKQKNQEDNTYVFGEEENNVKNFSNRKEYGEPETLTNIKTDLEDLLQKFKDLKKEIKNEKGLNEKNKKDLLEEIKTKLDFLSTLQEFSISADNPKALELMSEVYKQAPTTKRRATIPTASPDSRDTDSLKNAAQTKKESKQTENEEEDHTEIMSNHPALNT